jgi:hypothetical protein
MSYSTFPTSLFEFIITFFLTKKALPVLKEIEATSPVTFEIVVALNPL